MPVLEIEVPVTHDAGGSGQLHPHPLTPSATSFAASSCNAAVVTVQLGVSLASAAELSFNWLGFLSAMMSNLTFGFRAVWSKKAMSDIKNLSSTAVYAYTTLISVFICTPGVIIFEGAKLGAGMENAIAILGAQVRRWPPTPLHPNISYGMLTTPSHRQDAPTWVKPVHRLWRPHTARLARAPGLLGAGLPRLALEQHTCITDYTVAVVRLSAVQQCHPLVPQEHASFLMRALPCRPSTSS